MVSKGKISKTPDNTHAYPASPHPDWPNNLTGKFQAVYADEAQIGLRNDTSTFWWTLKWLQPKEHTILFSGYPAPRGVDDFYSYLRLVEDPVVNREAQSDQPQYKYLCSEDPYKLPDDHPATQYRLSSYAFKRWILLDQSLDQFERGAKAQKALKMFVIRRDYDSANPLGSNNTIARSLPDFQQYTVERAFSPTALKMYRKFAKM
jgi:hypothetical protein